MKAWLKSGRTRYGKLTNERSGSGSKTHSKANQFIVDHWKFIQEHITRIEGRKSSKKVRFIVYVINK